MLQYINYIRPQSPVHDSEKVLNLLACGMGPEVFINLFIEKANVFCFKQFHLHGHGIMLEVIA